MNSVALMIMVAIVLEALVEYGKSIGTMFDKRKYKTAVTQIITILLGVGLAFAFNLQLFNGVMSNIYTGLSINPVIDTILTGILFSRGSNYFSDLISKLTGQKTSEPFGVDDIVCDERDFDPSLNEAETSEDLEEEEGEL